MKNHLFCFLMLACSLCFGQIPIGFFSSSNPELNFTNDSSSYFVGIDTSNHGNIWQIGIPQKTIFNAPYSTNLRALLTDTINSYPVKNTSSFIIAISGGGWNWGGGYIGFHINVTHRFETDSLKDGGMIEIFDKNVTQTWQNIRVASDVYPNGGFYKATDTIRSLNNQSGFTGNSDGWQTFRFWVGINMYPDTALLRFTFASDSIDTGKDGWMIGQISLEGVGEGVQEYANNNLISLSPNPANNELSFNSEEKFNKPFDVSIYNIVGEFVSEGKLMSGNKFDISTLPPDIYMATFKNDNFYASKKFIVQK